METIVFCLLITKKYIDSKQRTLKSHICCFQEMFRNILQSITWKKKKKTGLSGQLSDFSVDYDVTDISNIISIQTCSMKKAQCK